MSQNFYFDISCNFDLVFDLISYLSHILDFKRSCFLHYYHNFDLIAHILDLKIMVFT